MVVVVEVGSEVVVEEEGHQIHSNKGINTTDCIIPQNAYKLYMTLIMTVYILLGYRSIEQILVV